MREQSSKIKRNSHTPNDIRGGEKKVMKKGLALLLAASMATSAFASAAAAADMTAQEKFEALVEANVFTGFEDGSSRLDQEMTRAELAAVISRLLDLGEKPANADYTDLKDAEWARGFIGAVTPTYMNGYGGGLFGPSDKFTFEQLAKVMSIVLDLEIDEKATVEGKVSDNWSGVPAAAYVAAAVKAGLVKEQADYTANALRSALVEASFTAYNETNVPAEIGVSKVEATDAAELTVTLNGPVDTEKAKFEVKKDGVVATVKEVKFADDKRSAKLTLDPKLSDATYSVTLSGIENLDEDKTVAEVKATAEKIASIEFVTASETLSQSENVKIEFQALNQYGKKSQMKASDFDIRVSNRDVEDAGGVSYSTSDTSFTINTFYDGDNDGRNDIQRNDRVSITILHQESGAQANAIYTIGDSPWITKVELGDVVDDQGQKLEYIRAELGEKAYVKLVAYDQYGVQVKSKDVLNGTNGGGITATTSDSRVLDAGELTIATGRTDRDTAFNADVDNDGQPELLLTVTADEKVEKEVAVTLYASGVAVTKNVMVRSPKNAASFEFAPYTKALADKDENKYIPVIVKDSDGNQLSAQDIVDNADQFRIYSNGPVRLATPEIKASGDDKGKIHILDVRGTGSSRIEISLRDKPSVSASINVNAGKERYPERLTWKDELADQVLVGAEAKFKYKSLDQYGEDYKKDHADLDVAVTFERTSGTGSATLTVPGGSLTAGQTETWDDFDAFFDKDFKLTGVTGKATYKITAKVIDTANSNRVKYELVKSISSIEGTESNANLTYEVKVDKLNADSSIMATQEVYEAYANRNGLTVTGNVYYDAGREFVTPTFLNTNVGKLGKEITVSAKQGTRVVAIQDSVTEITSSNPNVVQGVAIGGKGYIFGYDAGTATVVVKFNTPTGTRTVEKEIKVVQELPAVDTVTFEKTARNVTYAKLSAGISLHHEDVAKKITVKDQFANEFVSEKAATGDEKNNVNNYNHLLGLTYSVSNIKWSTTAGADAQVDVTISDAGLITVTNANVKSFTVEVKAPNGKKATLEVSVD
ncbi:S-layer homology domain-containing protein [Paenibacillus sp. TRM 82003]|nr:S-layer homology domain-containing protein [Paenibacillus sp. TRM 82003]MCI3923430.1 S-layer homology domain-containing protein [Paenibacillus sp. TRM 82003]